ncbi:MAG: glycine cleavage T C-terminal barrel domain-containing protein [Ardenticatenaceae bacterium]
MSPYPASVPSYAQRVAGHIASGNYGYSIDKFIAMAWLPAELAIVGTHVQVQFTGVRYEGVVVQEPLFDAKMKRMRA